MKTIFATTVFFLAIAIYLPLTAACALSEQTITKKPYNAEEIGNMVWTKNTEGVREILGEPDKIEKHDNSERWYYKNKVTFEGKLVGYAIEFKNGKYDNSGTGDY